MKRILQNLKDGFIEVVKVPVRAWVSVLRAHVHLRGTHSLQAV